MSYYFAINPDLPILKIDSLPNYTIEYNHTTMPTTATSVSITDQVLWVSKFFPILIAQF